MTIPEEEFDMVDIGNKKENVNLLNIRSNDKKLSITDSDGHSELGHHIDRSGIGNEDYEAEMEDITSKLEHLQTDEQRSILDAIAHLRTCGLDGDLLLPQLVVCGDQSSGKSSTLEALTEIPFPRNDNLCTRYATELHLRRAPADSLSVRVIPDNDRSEKSKASITDFKCTIKNFDELPRIMAEAMGVMGIDNGDAESSRVFSKDVLSIEIEGPKRPQLTLVDIPGLIHTETRGITHVDVQLVSDITDKYISQPRTICLAVIAATSDYATQKILKKVREYDPDGERTLGIITKPDRIEGKGSYQAFLELAQNRDIQFRLGWHVLKNRNANEAEFTFDQRKQSEKKWLSESIFQALDPNCRGIDALRQRLSLLLFEHAKREIPKLREELENKLQSTLSELAALGTRRTSISECKDYLMRLFMSYREICKDGIDGHYENLYFQRERHPTTLSAQKGDLPPSRIRAVVQTKNEAFAQYFRKNGQKYIFNLDEDKSEVPSEFDESYNPEETNGNNEKANETCREQPIEMGKSNSLRWVRGFIDRCRGRELIGDFNPLVIGELFWVQSFKWEKLAAEHVEKISIACSEFLKSLVHHQSPPDMRERVWGCLIADRLKERKNAAHEELNNTEKRKKDRREKIMSECLKNKSTYMSKHSTPPGTNLEWIIDAYNAKISANMNNVESEAALDSLISIYKVAEKVFIANITTQVVERHIVKDLQDIFSPLVVDKLSDEQIKGISTEPPLTRQERHMLEAKIKQLKAGQNAFKKVMGISLL